MTNLWDKVKQTLEQSAKSIKETTETTAKSVAETASKVASTVAEKSKDFATTIGDKTQEVVATGQLKLKLYNLSRDVSQKFNELGAHTFELVKNKAQNIYDDAQIKKMINEIQKLEAEIAKLEKQIETVRKAKPAEEKGQKAPAVQSSNDKTK